MKKVLMTALMLLFASTIYAAGATFSMTGDAYFQGNYWGNVNTSPERNKSDYSDTSFGYYESDINLYPKIETGNTSLNFKVTITDTVWGGSNNTDSFIDSDDNTIGTFQRTEQFDDVINIERAWLKHKFNDTFTLDVGLQDGTQWATTFGDDKTGRWRVKLVETTSMGVFGQVLEKIQETAATGVDVDDATAFPLYDIDPLNAKAEEFDSDNYGLFWIGKAGNIYIKPLLFYCDLDGSVPGSNQNYLKRFNMVLAFNGDLGGISFETEFNYNRWKERVVASADIAPLGITSGDYLVHELWNNWGYYLNLWKAMDNMTPGFTFAYGSYNDKAPMQAAFDFEDDFNSTVILGDMYCWGGGGDDIQGMTLYKLYVNDIKTPNKAITANVAFAFVNSNQKDTDYENASAWEIDAGLSYAITDNLTYHPYAGYADISYDADQADDPEPVWLLAHALEFSF